MLNIWEIYAILIWKNILELLLKYVYEKYTYNKSKIWWLL